MQKESEWQKKEVPEQRMEKGMELPQLDGRRGCGLDGGGCGHKQGRDSTRC